MWWDGGIKNQIHLKLPTHRHNFSRFVASRQFIVPRQKPNLIVTSHVLHFPYHYTIIGHDSHSNQSLRNRLCGGLNTTIHASRVVLLTYLIDALPPDRKYICELKHGARILADVLAKRSANGRFYKLATVTFIGVILPFVNVAVPCSVTNWSSFYARSVTTGYFTYWTIWLILQSNSASLSLFIGDLNAAVN